MNNALGNDRRTIRVGSRSFYFASRLFHRGAREEIAELYAFCRWIDDLVDERRVNVDVGAALAEVREELDGARPPRPESAAFLALAERRRIDVRLAHLLIDGVESDLREVRFGDDAELLRYCYRVAGTVGLMMCRVLGAEDPAAHPHAIDLGIAMQLTNICRDVVEDSARNRIYLPGDRFPGGAAQISRDHSESIARVVLGLLELADRYYASAEAGLVYLPPRARPGIIAAGRIYREIGTLLRLRGGDVFLGRAHVSGGRKLRVAARALFDLWRLERTYPCHEGQLHASLIGLPSVNAG